MTDEQYVQITRLLEELISYVKPKPKREHKAKAQAHGFQDFWRIYPKKVAIGEAEKAWAKISPQGLLLLEILEAVKRQARSEKWREDGGKFIPNPATWLNQRRWEDQAQVQVAPTQPPVMYKKVESLPKGEAAPPEVLAILNKLAGKDMSF